MRLLLYTGKGGVGKTTTAAATAAHAASLGQRTLVLSADAAHSLGDVVGQPLGADPIELADSLWGVEVDTRVELKEYDPGLARICEEVFGKTVVKYTKPTTRLHGHMAGYDPSTAPTFRWPERLKEAQQEIHQKARSK